jgi:hypothetical protein
VRAVPRVEFALQPLALGEQRAVLRREVGDERGEVAPVGIAREADGRQHLVVDEAVEHVGNLEAVHGRAAFGLRRPGRCVHGRSSCGRGG